LATYSVTKRCAIASVGTKSVRSPFGKAALTAVFVCALGSVWEFRRPWFQGNLGIVDPQRVIRSAQPTAQLPRLVRDFHLRSILNLRGGKPEDWWYEAEVRTVEENRMSFYDLQLSATRRPTRLELLRLIDILRQCPYPLLIHCKSGADRTGLASALYRMVQRGETPEQALGAFSIEFGHVPLCGTQHLHEPLDEYAAWLRTNRLSHTPERFRAWVRNDYRAADPPSDPPPYQTGPRARR
jgi:Tyrosine phosphatase family